MAQAKEVLAPAQAQKVSDTAKAVQPAPQPVAQAGGAPEFFIDLRPRIITLPDFKNPEQINVRYPLLPPYAFAHIYWDDKAKELVYQIEEQQLTETEKELLKLIQLGLEEMINISFSFATKSSLILKYLERNVQSILAELGAKVSKQSYLKIMYYIYRDFVGMNEIEPIMNDYYIEDIECNGVDSSVYVVHRKYQNLRTTLVYSDMKKLVDFVEKLAQKTGRYVSYARPLLDGTLPDGSRVNATYTIDVTTHGPTFTIRKFTKDPLTPLHLIGYGTASAETFAYLWMAVEHKFNIVTIGETASGKTTLLNAIMQFVPSEARIVSIEDTRELNLFHENWVPAVARVGFGVPNLLGKQYGEISLFDLLRASFRQNPDYVIVGEVRGKETYVLFQGMASVPGDQKILVVRNNRPTLMRIDQLNDVMDCKVVSYDPASCKAKLLPIAAHITHPARKTLLSITTKTGRQITCTPDHSLFSVSEGTLKDIAAGELAVGSSIAIAGYIPCGYADITTLYLPDILPDARIYAPELVRAVSRSLGYAQASQTAGIASITDYYGNFARSSPASMSHEQFFHLTGEAGMAIDYGQLQVKMLRKSRPVAAELRVSNEFLRLLGYFVSEGTLNFSGKNSSFALYNKRQDILADMRSCISSVTGAAAQERQTTGFGTCTELKIGNCLYAELLRTLCGQGSAGKRIPDFVYGLSKERIGEFISGLFTGDGYVTRQSIGYSTISEELAQQLQQLLLAFGIVASLYNQDRTNSGKVLYHVVFYREEYKQEFMKYVRVLGRQPVLARDGARFTRKTKDVYLDTVKAIEVVENDEAIPVFDLSVPGAENFLSARGIILHNSGHSSFSTFHAASVETLVRRLETAPINLPASLVDSLDIVINVMHIKDQRRNMRRMRDLREILEVKQQLGIVDTNTLFDWNPVKDEFAYNGNSDIFKIISKRTGIDTKALEKEMFVRAAILRKLLEKNMTDYKEFTRIVNMYYKQPGEVIKMLGVTP